MQGRPVQQAWLVSVVIEVAKLAGNGQPDALCRETRPCVCSWPNAICARQGSGSRLELPVLSRDQTPNPKSAVTTIEAAAAHSRSRL